MSASLTNRILDHVNNPNYQPVKPAFIAKQLGISGEATQELKKTIKRMVKAGELAWGPSHLVISTQKIKPRESEAPPAIVDEAQIVSHEKDRRKQKQKSSR